MNGCSFYYTYIHTVLPISGESFCEDSGKVFFPDGVQYHHSAREAHHEENVFRRQGHRAEHLGIVKYVYMCVCMVHCVADYKYLKSVCMRKL